MHMLYVYTYVYICNVRGDTAVKLYSKNDETSVIRNNTFILSVVVAYQSLITAIPMTEKAFFKFQRVNRQRSWNPASS